MPDTILVADDSEIARAQLVQALQRAGFATVEAENGQIALDIVKTSAVRLIITDVRMPVLTGIELCEAVQQSTIDPKPPVLIVSAESNAQLRERAKAAGARGWIIKPVDTDAVVRVARSLIK